MKWWVWQCGPWGCIHQPPFPACTWILGQCSGWVRPAMTERPWAGWGWLSELVVPTAKKCLVKRPWPVVPDPASLLLHIHSAWAIAALDVGISGADLGGPQE